MNIATNKGLTNSLKKKPQFSAKKAKDMQSTNQIIFLGDVKYYSQCNIAKTTFYRISLKYNI